VGARAGPGEPTDRQRRKHPPRRSVIGKGDVRQDDCGTDKLVSVVLPTYDRPDLLGRAIESVLSQSYRSWELIVVDDNSPDSAARLGTERFMARFVEDARVKYLRHEVNRGGAAARNTGIRAAAGEFVAFLDDDDEWEPAKLERQVAALERAQPTAAVAYCGFRKVFDDSGLVKLVLPVPPRHGLDELFRRNTIGTTSAIMCRRQALLDVGLFDETLPRRQDIDLYVRLARRSEFVPIPEVLLTWHRHGRPSIGRSGRNSIEGNRLFLLKHRAEFESRPAAHHYRLVAIGRMLARDGEHLEARAAFLRAWRLKPADPRPLVRALFTNRPGARLACLYSLARRRAVTLARR
jgi:GT2 family glycosyltransferase